jgi:hypothetical protein
MQSFAIIFTPTPGNDVPPEIRLRRLLKSALRQHGLRCIDIRELPADAPDAPGAAPTCDDADAGPIVAGARNGGRRDTVKPVCKREGNR